MGAWIEMIFHRILVMTIIVAPLVGAWIEISCSPLISSSSLVAPLVGAWIEIAGIRTVELSRGSSLPSWERGLKLKHMDPAFFPDLVAPLVGAWIEIPYLGHMRPG